MTQGLGGILGRYLEREIPRFEPYVPQDFDALCNELRIGDVLLVEGRARISTAIKYLTQSTWSHAALCVADRYSTPDGSVPTCSLVEVTLQQGCHLVPVAKYARHNTRICRAAGLSEDERRAVAQFMIDRLGLRYDLRNVLDLLRYVMLPVPPVPIRWRRRMLALGSGDPTRAICSSLIAQAFQSVRYPILPEIRTARALGTSDYSRREVWHIRHHSLFVPRDFDLSPYFSVVKPLIRRGFDHRRIPWAADEDDSNAALPKP